VEVPLLEAQLLLAHALGSDRLRILTRGDESISSEAWVRFEALVSRRTRREPLAYIRGTQEFYGLEFRVGPDVLVPRPETELLVELAIQHLGRFSNPCLIDVGTGSGCIAIAAARHSLHARVIAVERSPKAIETARANAERHGVAERVSFVECDFREASLPDGIEMIVSNPPYIPSEELERLPPEVRNFEPRLALDGGGDGLEFHRAIARLAVSRLRTGGMLAVEVGAGQSHQVMDIFEDASLKEICSEHDLQGIERVVHGRKSA
jgi:release factor glutamine methyltransferase